MYNDYNGGKYRRPMRMNHGYGTRSSKSCSSALPCNQNEQNSPNTLLRGEIPPEQPMQNNGCKQNGWGIYEHPLSMVYSPYQIWRNIYKEETALSRGTLFSELDLPFEGKRCK